MVSAANRNDANAWHAKPLGTWAISKLPKESELLAFGKNFTNKGVGVTATVSLGLNAWDDFYHYGTRVGSKRFAVDVFGALSGIGISAFATGIEVFFLGASIGPVLGGAIGIGVSIELGKKFWIHGRILWNKYRRITMDKYKGYLEYGLLLCIIASCVLKLGDYVQLIIFILVTIGSLLATIKLIRDNRRISGIVTFLLSTFMGIHSSLEIYAEMFNNKYLPFFQSKIMITIGRINIIMLGLMAAIALYRETDESNRYIFYNIIKLGIIGSIIALVIYFVPSLLF